MKLHTEIRKAGWRGSPPWVSWGEEEGANLGASTFTSCMALGGSGILLVPQSCTQMARVASVTQEVPHVQLCSSLLVVLPALHLLLSCY